MIGKKQFDFNNVGSKGKQQNATIQHEEVMGKVGNGGRHHKGSKSMAIACKCKVLKF